MKSIYTNRNLAPAYRKKIEALGWFFVDEKQNADIVSFKTRGMFGLLKEFEHPMAVWGIPTAFHLVAKQNMWLNIKTYYGIERAAKLSPFTYLLKNRSEYEEAELALKQGKSMVLKTNRQRRQGLVIANTLEEFNSILSSDHVIAQELKTDTLEYSNRKFHLRYYIAISIKKGVFRAFLYPKARLVFGKRNPKTVHEKYITQNEYYDPSLPIFVEELIEKKVLKENTLNQTAQLFGLVLKPFKKILLKHTSDKTCYFDLFGADVIFTNEQKALLVEINRSPSMAAINKTDEDFKQTIADSFLNAIDHLIDEFAGWQELKS